MGIFPLIPKLRRTARRPEGECQRGKPGEVTLVALGVGSGLCDEDRRHFNATELNFGARLREYAAGLRARFNTSDARPSEEAVLGETARAESVYSSPKLDTLLRE